MNTTNIDVTGLSPTPSDQNKDNYNRRRYEDILDYLNSLDEKLEDKLQEIKDKFKDHLEELKKETDKVENADKEQNSC